MRLSVVSEMGADWQQTLEKVRIAEDLGFDQVNSTEAWGVSSIPWLTMLVQHTSRMRVGSSILNVFSRTPAALAQEFAFLDQLSGGRMVLGLGSSGAQVIEHFHGVPFDRPLRRLREYTEIFNILISGERLNYEGEIFQMSRGFRLDYDRPRDHIPIFIAAITPRSIRQTGEIADGIIPIHWPKGQFAALRDQLAEGASAAGRDGAALTIAAWTHVTILDGEHDEEAWRSARQPLFHYINRMGTFYWQMLERNGFEAEVAASRAAWAERDMEGAVGAISDQMVREVQVIGPLEAVREQLQERSALGADIQALQMPQGEPAAIARQWEALLR